MDRRDDSEERRRRQMATDATLSYFVLPVWSAAGFLDWCWHRGTRIQETAGPRESIMHSVMALQGGLAVGLGLLCEIDAGVIAGMLGAALVHEATVIWDVNYTLPRREIYQWEWYTHSFMEVMPFVAVGIAATMHPGQAFALVGLGKEARDFGFRLRPPRVRPLSLLATLAVCGAVGVLPHIEEFIRCWRAKPTLAPLPPHLDKNDPRGGERRADGAAR